MPRRSLIFALVSAVGLGALSGCLSTPKPDKLPPATGPAPAVAEVSRAIHAMPHDVRRPFFTTIHALGKRITASGMLDLHSPFDFRVTAVTEMGVVLFDARYNWAGAKVMRTMPGLDASIVQTLVRDLSLALRTPESLEGLQRNDHQSVLKRTDAEGNKFTYTFGPGGFLRTTDIQVGTFDTVRAIYRDYTAKGWPKDMTLYRPARGYNIQFTFTDEP